MEVLSLRTCAAETFYCIVLEQDCCPRETSLDWKSLRFSKDKIEASHYIDHLRKVMQRALQHFQQQQLTISIVCIIQHLTTHSYTNSSMYISSINLVQRRTQIQLQFPAICSRVFGLNGIAFKVNAFQIR